MKERFQWHKPKSLGLIPDWKSNQQYCRSRVVFIGI